MQIFAPLIESDAVSTPGEPYSAPHQNILLFVQLIPKILSTYSLQSKML